MSFASEFKDFVLRGNVVDLAVGVVIGGAFGTLVGGFTKDIITPLIGLAGKHDLGSYDISVGPSIFHIGDFVNSIIAFIILAFVIFAFVVKPINWLMAHSKAKEPEPETTRDCPECLSKVPLAAKRCAFCTATLSAA